jgi:hypothetical protein
MGEDGPHGERVQDGGDDAQPAATAGSMALRAAIGGAPLPAMVLITAVGALVAAAGVIFITARSGSGGKPRPSNFS